MFEGKSAEDRKSKKNAMSKIKKKKTSRGAMGTGKKWCFGLCNRRKSTKVTDVEADEGGDPNSKDLCYSSTL